MPAAWVTCVGGKSGSVTNNFAKQSRNLAKPTSPRSRRCAFFFASEVIGYLALGGSRRAIQAARIPRHGARGNTRRVSGRRTLRSHSPPAGAVDRTRPQSRHVLRRVYRPFPSLACPKRGEITSAFHPPAAASDAAPGR